MSEPGTPEQRPDQDGPAGGGPSQPYPGGGPAGPQAYPVGGSSGPQAYPAGEPSGPQAYPAGEPSGPQAYPGGGPAGPQAYPAVGPAGPQPYPVGGPPGPQPYQPPYAAGPSGPPSYSAGGPSGSGPQDQSPYPTAGPPPYQAPPFQYPQWQPPAPPKKTSSGAVVLIAGSVVVVIVVVLAFLAWGWPGFLRKPDAYADGDRVTAAPPSRTTAETAPSSAATVPGGRAPMPKRPTPLADPVTCAFTADPALPAPKKATPPPDGPAPSSGTVDVRLATSAGDIGLTLDRALAPCTVVNFLSLAKQGFYDGTSCHRLSVQAGLRMLQCGDPGGDGTGGPGYTIRDEAFPELTYGRGILAMAKTSQPDSGGSQFFMIYGDTTIPPDYTVFGSIDDAGLAVLDKVAGGGVDPAKPGMDDGSGPPKIPVTFTHVTTP